MQRDRYFSMWRSVGGLVILFMIILSGCGGVAQQQSGTTNTGSSSSELQGTDLGETPAPGFQLVDQYGHSITLSQFKGMPVILTFFYTHCPDYCPLMAQKIHSSLVQLGSQAQKVAIVAISADPEGDTPASVATFSQTHQLQGYANWHYLLGTRQALTPIWASYHVSGVPPHAKMMSASAMQHSALIYVIDQQGQERVLLDSDFQPSQLTKDIQILL